MKIAINGAFFEPKGGGIKEYIDNLVNNLAILDKNNQFILYVLQDQLEYAKKNLPSEFCIKTIPFNSGSKLNRIKRSLFERQFWLKEEKEEMFDVFHSPFFHSPKLRKAKVLLTVHDLRLYRFPDTYEFFRYNFLKRKVKNSIKRADHIIAISEFTKKEIIELCGSMPDKITVIQEAINPNKFSADNVSQPDNLGNLKQEKPFLLTVGHMEPRKNYDRLIEAFNIIKKNPQNNDLQLVIVGKKDHSFKETLEKINQNQDIHYLNFVSGKSLNWLYKNAKLFVFPSYYEGFGFPPLEAASLGTISAVSNVASMPEVCGDSVFYFDPMNVSEMAAVIDTALNNDEERNKIKERLIPNLNRFSWKNNAIQTIKLYDKMLF